MVSNPLEGFKIDVRGSQTIIEKRVREWNREYQCTAHSLVMCYFAKLQLYVFSFGGSDIKGRSVAPTVGSGGNV